MQRISNLIVTNVCAPTFTNYITPAPHSTTRSKGFFYTFVTSPIQYVVASYFTVAIKCHIPDMAKL